MLFIANSWREDFHGGFKTCLRESLHPVRKLDQKQELLTMPHVNSSGGDDLASTDEVKVYKDEGEEENRSSENLLEDKAVLVTETEEVCTFPLLPSDVLCLDFQRAAMSDRV